MDVDRRWHSSCPIILANCLARCRFALSFLPFSSLVRRFIYWTEECGGAEPSRTSKVCGNDGESLAKMVETRRPNQKKNKINNILPMSTLGISAWLGWTEWMVVAIQTTKGKSWQMRTHTQPGRRKTDAADRWKGQQDNDQWIRTHTRSEIVREKRRRSVCGYHSVGRSEQD